LSYDKNRKLPENNFIGEETVYNILSLNLAPAKIVPAQGGITLRPNYCELGADPTDLGMIDILLLEVKGRLSVFSSEPVRR
jgi:hypothetical protein